MMFGWCLPESFKFTPMFSSHWSTTTTSTIVEMCKDALQDRLVYVNFSWLGKGWRGLKKEESAWVKQSTKQAQGQISLPLSLSIPIQTSSSSFSLRPQTLPVPPVFVSSCSTLRTQLVLISGRWWWVGIRMEPLAGKLRTHHTVVTDREKPPSDFLLCSSAAPVRQYISVDVQICACSVVLKASHWLLMTLVYLCNR